MSDVILIVGPDGFMGTRMVRELYGKKTIIGLGKRKTVNGHLDYFFSDVDILKKSYPDIATIYLFGAYIPYGFFNTPSSEFTKSNIELVAKLSLLYADSKIVFCSSVSVYGTPLQLPILIDSPFNKPDLYGISKLGGESIILNHKKYAIIRFSSILGKGMKTLTMVPRMVEAGKSGKIVVYGRGMRQQNYIDVRDAISMCLLAAESERNLIILGVGVNSVSNLEVAQYICSRLDASLEFSGEDESPSFIYDAEESYQLLNFRPKFSIHNSLDEIMSE